MTDFLWLIVAGALLMLAVCAPDLVAVVARHHAGIALVAEQSADKPRAVALEAHCLRY